MSRRKKTTDDLEEAKSLGLAILLLRRSRGMTLKALSAASGSTRPNLSRYELGRALPRLHILRRLMSAMDLPLLDLYRAQRLVDEVMGRETGEDAGDDGTLPPDRRPELSWVPQVSREDAVRLAQEAGKAVAHCCLAFMELQAGGWKEMRDGE